MSKPEIPKEVVAVEAKALRALFNRLQPRVSQADFGAMHNIGNQSMVWQYLEGERPLNIPVAIAFAHENQHCY